jgi:hypothetical protein
MVGIWRVPVSETPDPPLTIPKKAQNCGRLDGTQLLKGKASKQAHASSARCCDQASCPGGKGAPPAVRPEAVVHQRGGAHSAGKTDDPLVLARNHEMRSSALVRWTLQTAHSPSPEAATGTQPLRKSQDTEQLPIWCSRQRCLGRLQSSHSVPWDQLSLFS